MKSSCQINGQLQVEAVTSFDMHEIAPGLWHWTARHPHIRSHVSSYYLRPERVALDPLLPAKGLGWFEGVEPEHVVLTNRHHDRDAWRLQEAFGCQVYCAEAGIHELEGRGALTPFAFGEELPVRSTRSAPRRPRCIFRPTERWPSLTASCAGAKVRTSHSCPMG